MSGHAGGGSVLSLRVTREERARLLAIKRERGCTTLSQAIRLLIGFPRTGPFEELDGADDVESVSTLARMIVVIKDRCDQQHQLLIKIARHLEIPVAERQQRKLPPKEKQVPIVVSTAPIDDDDSVFAYRNGHQHPELPDGFSRG